VEDGDLNDWRGQMRDGASRAFNWLAFAEEVSS
jgi:hypothetical protein